MVARGLAEVARHALPVADCDKIGFVLCRLRHRCKYPRLNHDPHIADSTPYHLDTSLVKCYGTSVATAIISFLAHFDGRIRTQVLEYVDHTTRL